MITEGRIVYFQAPGPENTEDVFRIAKARAEQLGIKNILVASTIGHTGAKATEFFKGSRVIVVSHFTGFREPNTAV
jgi:hypothetical protein